MCRGEGNNHLILTLVNRSGLLVALRISLRNLMCQVSWTILELKMYLIAWFLKRDLSYKIKFTQ
jgi:hypothetical protein